MWWQLWKVDEYCIFWSNMEDEDGMFFMYGFFILWFCIQKRMSRWFRLHNGTICVFYIFFSFDSDE